MVTETLIEIRIGNCTVDGSITDEHSPQTVAQLRDILPLEGRPQRWGQEFYFKIPLHLGAENAMETVDVGTLAYWPRGHAFCIFYGETPASEDDQPKAASPVNVVGELQTVEPLHMVDTVSEIQIHRV